MNSNFLSALKDVTLLASIATAVKSVILIIISL